MADKMRFYPTQRDRTQFVPSVTTVCSVLAKPGLTRWLQEQAIIAAADDLALYGEVLDYQTYSGPMKPALSDFVAGGMNKWLEDANEQSRIAAGIGIEVHETLEHFHKGEAYELYPDRLATGLVLSYQDWYTASVVKPLLVERQVFGVGQLSGLAYAGTLDLCAQLGPKPIIYQTEKRTRYGEQTRLAVVDIKTSGDYYPEMGMQLAAYAASELVENAIAQYGDMDPYLLTVRLDKESKRYYVKEWSFQRYYTMFEAALRLWYELNPSAAENYGKKMAKLTEVPVFDSDSNIGAELEVEVDSEWFNE